jgi:hypothetical protein
MAGGPINGSALYGDAALSTNPAATIIVPTVLQIASDVADSFKNITCMYDRYWYARRDMMTLPICFFYVKSISKTMRTETSKKRILLYEPQMASADAVKAKLADPIRPGVQEVIIDNSVINTPTYQLEVILPFQPMNKQFARTVMEAQQITEALLDIFDGTSVDSLSPMDVMGTTMKTVSRLVDLAAIFSNGAGTRFINANSLEAMWLGQKVLTMKMWAGYEYKYVQIVGLDIKKEGTEDDVFRATINVEERPVLTMTPATDATKPSGPDLNWAASVVGGLESAYTTVAAEFTGIRQASGA